MSTSHRCVFSRSMARLLACADVAQLLQCIVFLLLSHQTIDLSCSTQKTLNTEGQVHIQEQLVFERVVDQLEKKGNRGRKKEANRNDWELSRLKSCRICCDVERGKRAILPVSGRPSKFAIDISTILRRMMLNTSDYIQGAGNGGRRRPSRLLLVPCDDSAAFEHLCELQIVWAEMQSKSLVTRHRGWM